MTLDVQTILVIIALVLAILSLFTPVPLVIAVILLCIALLVP